ncbi:MAG: PIG-L deacetylase family protein [Acidimicrobiales bacterium]
MDGELIDRKTLLCLHAHPDDEAMLTGQLIAKAGSTGMRTIVVYGTRGEAGEARDELGTETLGLRRAREAVDACAELGAARVEFLDYVDSGMAGEPTNAVPSAFSNASPEVVADVVADLIAGEELFAVVGYDANGTYGHPDHLQIHAVANAIARLLRVPWLLDATYNREYLAGLAESDGSLDPGFATSDAELTHFVQGEAWFRAKMEAVKQHRSQVPPKRSGQPKRGIDRWRSRYGTEWFIARQQTNVTGLGPLANVLEPKADWPGPLTRATPSGEAGP